MKSFTYAPEPERTYTLRVGRGAGPSPIDWHNRGESDLLVTHDGGVRGPGVTLFRVIGRDARGLPIYDEGLPIEHFGPATAVTAWPNGQSSRFDVLTAHSGSLWRFPNVGSAYDPYFGDPLEIPLPLEFRSLGCVAKLSLADVDRDGNLDLLLGLSNESGGPASEEMSWCGRLLGTDTSGRNIALGPHDEWRGATLHGHLVWLKNYRSLRDPDFALGGPILLQGQPIDLRTLPAAAGVNWPWETLPALVSADAHDRLALWLPCLPDFGFREVRPAAVAPRGVDATDIPIPVGEPRLAAGDIDRDGRDDLLVGGRSGEIFGIQTLRPSPDVPPTFSLPFPLQTLRRLIHLGSFPVPAAADWDGDGDLDLVVGCAEGRLLWIENRGTTAEPLLATPEPVLVNGVPLIVQAGLAGCPNGPRDAAMGYLCPEVVDWDGDGRPDLLLNDFAGRLILYRNIGSRERPEFGPGIPLLKAGKPFLSLWRARPSCVDWDGDGLPELLALDLHGFLNLYQRDGDQVRAGRRLTDQLGRGIQLDGSLAGCGQANLCACDWDGDGDLDVLVGLPARNGHVWQNLSGGDPPSQPPPSILLLENVGSRKRPVFAPRALQACGLPLFFGPGGCAPHAASWTGGKLPDLIVGADDGLIYFFPRSEVGIL
ncbi:MAG: VCBS repeat-containing protein [Planctomycetes bacterium]|nr:VCBS repeat-containing protein [Planctomycetota bacterium]